MPHHSLEQELVGNEKTKGFHIHFPPPARSFYPFEGASSYQARHPMLHWMYYQKNILAVVTLHFMTKTALVYLVFY